MIAWTGPIFDHNYDGLADDPIINGSEPSHVFIILLKCSTGNWQQNGRHCANPEESETMAFVLPLLAEHLNCLASLLKLIIFKIRQIKY
jgi:hypothetical protein